jgi:hypothetical protein
MASGQRSEWCCAKEPRFGLAAQRAARVGIFLPLSSCLRGRERLRNSTMNVATARRWPLRKIESSSYRMLVVAVGCSRSFYGRQHSRGEIEHLSCLVHSERYNFRRSSVRNLERMVGCGRGLSCVTLQLHPRVCCAVTVPLRTAHSLSRVHVTPRVRNTTFLELLTSNR